MAKSNLRWVEVYRSGYIYILKNNEDVAGNLLKNIRRGLVKYPFDRVYMY